VKIILVHNSYQQPGGEDVVFQQERKLLEDHGHQVVVYQRSNWETDSYDGMKRLVLVRNTVWSSDSRNEFARLLRSEKPDLVHVHNTFVMISPSIYSACREAGVPVVQTLHNFRLLCPGATFFRDGRICEECTEHSLLRSVVHKCYRESRSATAAVAMMLATHRLLGTWEKNVSAYIALTQFTRKKFVKNGLPANKVFVKPNFVHPDPGMSRGDGGYVLFAGRLSPEKRVSTLLSAWTLLSKDIPLMVIGGGPERESLEREAREVGLSHVTFRGQLSRPETLEAMRRARFLVFSSEWYENFPVTIAESFGVGLPVICSRLGAMQEIVEDRRTGLHFTTGDAHDLAEKVGWAWKNREFVEGLGRAARREYEEKYTAEKNYPMLMNIYARALAAKSVPQAAPAAPASAEPASAEYVDQRSGD
jgi:glycosyltransferase involved in cell wall biosynthesis